jgi:hypothetical protein
MKFILLLVCCYIITTSYGQTDTAKIKCKNCFVGIGISVGVPFQPNSPTQPYGIQNFPDQREFYSSSEIEFGLRLPKKMQMTLNYSSRNFNFSYDTHDAKMQNQFPELYYYNDDKYQSYRSNSDEFMASQSYGGRVLVLKFSRLIESKNIGILPTLGAGIEKWNHKGYRFTFREPGQNDFTTYLVNGNFKSNLVIEPSVSFTYKKIPLRLELGITHSVSKLDYDISYTNSRDNISHTENIEFEKNLTGFYTALVFGGLLHQ